MTFLSSKSAIYVSLGVLLVVIAGGFAYIGAIKSVVGSSTGQEVEKAAISTIVSAENPLYNVFTNHAIGYSVEFPKSWNIDDSDLRTVVISAGEEGSKYIKIDVPYPLDVLEDQDFMTWAETQDWPFSPTLPSEYFAEIKVPSGLSTYKRAGTSTVHTVIAPIESNVLYINRVNGTGEGTLEGEDIYFHLLNSLNQLKK